MIEQQLPSNRSIGRLFAIVCAILSGLAFWHGRATAPYLLALAVAFVLVTWLRPDWLGPLNRAWMGLALILNRIVSPVVLGIMYYALVTPVGVVRRLFGWDPMRRKRDPRAASYWIKRDPPGPPPESLKEQF